MIFPKISSTFRIQYNNECLLIILMSLCLIFLLIFHKAFYSISIFLLKNIEIGRSRQSFVFLFFQFFYSNIASLYLPYGIMILVYNYGTVYETLILFLEILVSKYLTGVLQLIFIETPLCYDKLIPYYIINEHKFSFPSEKLVTSPIFFLSFWTIISKGGDKENLRFFKNFWLILIIIFLLMICLSEIFLGISSIDQTLFSLMLSIEIYYVIFFIFKVNQKKYPKYIKFIISHLNYIVSLALIFLSFPIILYFIRKNTKEVMKLSEVVIPKYEINFDKAALLTSLAFSGIIFMFLGLKIGNKYNNKKSLNKYQRTFINEFDYKSLPLSQVMLIPKKIQGGNIIIMQSFFKVGYYMWALSLCFFPYYIWKGRNNLFFICIIKDFFYWGLLSFGWTFWFQMIINYLHLSNTKCMVSLSENCILNI